MPITTAIGHLKVGIAILLVLGGVVILQYHAISFWSMVAGDSIGWAWSIMIEVAALWLWYQGDTTSRLLGLLASLIVLAAPLYILWTDTMVAAQAAQASITTSSKAQSARQHMLHVSLKRHANTLNIYLQNSRERSGWAAEISRVQGLIQADEQALIVLAQYDVQAPAHDAHDAQAMLTDGAAMAQLGGNSLFFNMFIQCAGLILLQLANIRAMLFLSSCAALPVPNMSISPTVLGGDSYYPDRGGDVSFSPLQSELHTYMQQHGLTISQCSEQLNVPRQQLSFLLNYQQGRRKPSQAAVRALLDSIGRASS